MQYYCTGIVAEDAAKLWISDEKNIMPTESKSINFIGINIVHLLVCLTFD